MFIESTDIDGQKSEVMDITNDNDQNVLFFNILIMMKLIVLIL